MLTQAKQYPVFTLSFPSILMKGSSLAIHKAFRMENSHSVILDWECTENTNIHCILTM